MKTLDVIDQSPVSFESKPVRALSETIERVLLSGDLTPLKPEERVLYYHHVCEGVGLNPYSNPLAYIVLNGKLVLYAKKDATDQIRNKRKISCQIMSRDQKGDLYTVVARATDPTGRFDESSGVVALSRLQGDALANAFMKAETKAKRRATLSLSGLSLLDETEIESIKGAVRVNYDYVPQLQDKDADKKSIIDLGNPVCVKWAKGILEKNSVSADMHYSIMDEFEGKDARDFEAAVKKLAQDNSDSSFEK